MIILSPRVRAASLALFSISVLVQPAFAADAGGARDLVKATPSDQVWSAWGGTVGMRWNRELAGDIGLGFAQPTGQLPEQSARQHDLFPLRQAGSIDFRVSNGNLQAFVGGSLQARGGYVLTTPSGDIDLTDFRLRTRNDDPLLLDLVGADGKSWFYIDRLMYELVENNHVLAVRTMDVRISPELAIRLGHPDMARWAIADMEMTTQVQRQGSGAVPNGGGVYDWAGTPAVRPLGEPQPPPGAINEADLFMKTFSVQYSRCNGCTGASSAGQVVFTPTSTLQNNVNNGTAIATIPGDPLGTSTALWAADIPWYSKFTSNSPPYNNDQHPYLIWNMYRFNSDGTIDQIGRSGVKHAFLTTNQGCASGHGTNSHVLGRQCSDTYGAGNNDSNEDLGPRSEIIPATNQWGRCGSIYDTNCDGSSNTSGNGNYSQRLIVVESQMDPAVQIGATYLFESWYLAREDINIFNSMATRGMVPARSGSTWAVGGGASYLLGPAVDRWLTIAPLAQRFGSSEFASSEGHVKIAVKAFDLGGGSWRYECAVMNLDFARAYTEGSEAAHNLKVIHNFGLDRFSIADGGTISNLSFSDGDLDPANNWTATNTGGTITWAAPANPSPLPNVPAVLNPLNWGMMFRFSYVSNASVPGSSEISLHVAQTGAPANLVLPLVLRTDRIYADGFDSP